MMPKDQKNIITLMGSTGQRFTVATRHLTLAVMKYILKQSDPSEALIKTKLHESLSYIPITKKIIDLIVL
jgi:hypothetical protein